MILSSAQHTGQSPLRALAWLGLVTSLIVIGCGRQPTSDAATVVDQSDVAVVAEGDRPSIEADPFLDPTHPQYMAGPTVVHFPDAEHVHLNDSDYVAFEGQLRSFLETNNDGEYLAHFRDHYIPETFPDDSIFNMYVRMWGQWDSIGVRNRFDHWAVRYISPFYEGETYDVAIAEVDVRHHMVFEKRWTGNYRNFGRTLGERYPGSEVTYMDTTWVTEAGDTVLRRHITAEAPRFLYAVRGQGDELRGDHICWMNDGWQLVPDVVAIMDSAAVTSAQLHQEQYGTLDNRPQVSGR